MKAVWVRVLDVSRADAPSQTLAEYQLREVEVKAGDGVQSISFYLDKIESCDERADLAIAIHQDWSGSGEVERGDYLTVRSYPIDPAVGLQNVDIEVRQV